MLTREDVTAAYQFILGRPPESDEIIRQYIEDVQTVESLRETLFSSDEFVEIAINDDMLKRSLHKVISAMVLADPPEKSE